MAVLVQLTVVYPEGDGFVVLEVWRTESVEQHNVDDVPAPAGLVNLSLTTKDTHV